MHQFSVYFNFEYEKLRHTKEKVYEFTYAFHKEFCLIF